MSWCYLWQNMTMILNTVALKRELTRQFTAIPIWWKMVKIVLSRQNHSYLYSMALPEKSSQFVAILSTIYIQCPRCGISTFCRQIQARWNFRCHSWAFQRKMDWQWMILFVVCITRNMEWMCKICIEIHLIEVCISFYWWFHRCKS